MFEARLFPLLAVAIALGCTTNPESDGSGSEATESGDGDGDPSTGDGDGDGENGCPSEGCLDVNDVPSPPPCRNCIDLLLVIDNSGTMGEEQLALANAFPLLIEQLRGLLNKDGDPFYSDVNIMVTTTDMGHPLCTPLQPDGYEPKQGAPQSVACIDRIDDFTGVGADPPSFPEACQLGCPVAVEPVDPFIHFEGPEGLTTNVPDANVAGALACIGPQGINGCGYEAPLEAMLQATHPDAAWNQDVKPFMRDGVMLAVVFVTDEEDCSVRAPEGYAYFTDEALDDYWEINPETATKTHATSAVCWNAGVDCGAPDQNGIYADCTSIDTGVLHPTSRYSEWLEAIKQDQDKDVVMLGILGVPSVTMHDSLPPYQPIAGGVAELVYRQWIDGAWPDGDTLPGDGDAASKEFEFGIGPGCLGEDGMGGFTGHAIPPVRIKEVCQALDKDIGGPSERIGCCIESVCDQDYGNAFTCLTDMIQTIVAENNDIVD